LGLIDVSELHPPQVPFLQVTNLSNLPLLLLEGEMLIGGDQNRTLNVTILFSPSKPTVVPVSCVEARRWGIAGRRSMDRKSKFAPGSLRAAKIAHLEMRSAGSPSYRRSDQGLVWEHVSLQEVGHQLISETSALDDVQEAVEETIASDLDKLEAGPHQIGVVCMVGDDVIGMDLFDKSETLQKYLRSIVAGHALDAASPKEGRDPIGAIERFLAQVDAAAQARGEGVGLGDEVLLSDSATGVGLEFEGDLIHLAAFPSKR
jgi:hypothetical protein